MRDYIQEKEILRRFDEGQSIAYIADDIAMLSRTEAKNRNDSSLRYTKRQAREIVDHYLQAGYGAKEKNGFGGLIYDAGRSD